MPGTETTHINSLFIAFCVDLSIKRKEATIILNTREVLLLPIIKSFHLVLMGHLCIREGVEKNVQLVLLFIVLVLTYTLKYRRVKNPPNTPNSM